MFTPGFSTVPQRCSKQKKHQISNEKDICSTNKWLVTCGIQRIIDTLWLLTCGIHILDIILRINKSEGSEGKKEASETCFKLIFARHPIIHFFNSQVESNISYRSFLFLPSRTIGLMDTSAVIGPMNQHNLVSPVVNAFANPIGSMGLVRIFTY